MIYVRMGLARRHIGSEIVLWRAGTNTDEYRHEPHATASADASMHTGNGYGNQGGWVLYLLGRERGAFRADLPMSVWSRIFIAGEDQLPATIVPRFQATTASIVCVSYRYFSHPFDNPNRRSIPVE